MKFPSAQPLSAWNLVVPCSSSDLGSVLAALEVGYWLQRDHEEPVQVILLQTGSFPAPKSETLNEEWRAAVRERISSLRWTYLPVGPAWPNALTEFVHQSDLSWFTLDLRKDAESGTGVDSWIRESRLPFAGEIRFADSSGGSPDAVSLRLPLAGRSPPKESRLARFGRSRVLARQISAWRSGEQKVVASGKARESRSWAIIRPPSQIQGWVSLQEIVPSLEVFWATNCADLDPIFFDSDDDDLCARLAELAASGDLEAVVFLACTPYLAERVREALPAGTPFVFHLHGDAGHGFTASEKSPIDPFFAHDLLLCSSAADAHAIRVFYPDARTKVVPFPLDLVPGYPRKREFLRQEAVSRVVYAGRLAPQKNLHSLLVALAILKSRFGLRPELELYGAPHAGVDLARGVGMVGYQDFLKRIAKTLGVEDQLRFFGHLPKSELVAALSVPGSVFVSASVQPDENYGAAAALAIHLGRPAVLSAWGGHLDFGQRFTGQVDLVPVICSDTGPWVSPESLAEALAKRLRGGAKFSKARRRKIPALSPPREWLREISGIVPARLAASASLAELRQRSRRMPRGGRTGSLFPAPGDSVDMELAKAYGMVERKASHPKRALSRSLSALPWVIAKTRLLQIFDPLRGFCWIHFEPEAGSRAVELATRAVVPHQWKAGNRRVVRISPKLAAWLVGQGYAHENPERSQPSV